MCVRTVQRWLLLLTVLGVALMHATPVLAAPTPPPLAHQAVATGHHGPGAHAGHAEDVPVAPQDPRLPEHAQHVLTHCTAVLPTGVHLPTAAALLTAGPEPTRGVVTRPRASTSATTRANDPPDLQQLCISRT